MPVPYLGEIKMFSGNYAPRNWLDCDGRLLSVSDHDALFSLLGTTFGGDGRTNFGIPDYRGRIPISQGRGPGMSNNYTMGQRGGIETVALNLDQLPTHKHTLQASVDPADSAEPLGRVPATTPVPFYSENDPTTAMYEDCVAKTGGGMPHTNMQPSLGVRFIIAIKGEYPPRN